MSKDADIELRLLSVTQRFLTEIKSEQAARIVTVESILDKDLALGSLERVELFHQIEREFSIQLPLDFLITVTCLKDCVPLIQQMSPGEIAVPQQVSSVLARAKTDPSQAQSLVDLLQQYAECEPERIHIYYQQENGQEQPITYGQLYERAQTAAAMIARYKILPGETVAIMLPTCEEFFYFFFGILFAGAIPVPIYPPTNPQKIEEYVRRQAKVLQNAQIRLMITLARGQTLSKVLKSFIPSLEAIITIEQLAKTEKEEFTPYFARSADGAVIQYTSGSTGNPKGVLLSHRNLLANIRAVGVAIGITPADFMVSWLPLYHDMGLIGAWLGSLYFGVPVCIFSPLIFLMRPESWLWAIHHHRATISGAPNFAYEICVNQIAADKLSGLDLSSWRLALNGAEIIQASTLNKFYKKFAPYHFNSKALSPAYGLAESTMALLFNPLNREPKIERIDRETFIQTGQAVAVDSDKNYLELVSCGKPLNEHEVRIVSPDGQVQPDRQLGSLQFKGPSNTQGYYHNNAATQEIYQAGWLDSGDLAYQADGEIYLAGRKKDLIIIAGRNIHPEEIEALTNDIPGVISGGTVAFGIFDSRNGTEQCVIIAETEAINLKQREKIIHSVISKVVNITNINPIVELVKPKTIPKTASGKLQRSACKNAYLENKLTHHKNPIWVQLSKLWITGFFNNGLKIFSTIARVIYTLYAWCISMLVIIPLMLILLCPHSKQIYKIISKGAKLILMLLFCRLKVTGNQSDYQARPTILVANHPSYIDALVLVAALPVDLFFVAKQELLKLPILSTFIRKLKYVTVNRDDFQESVQEVDDIQIQLAKKRWMLLFPEGTFSYGVGLRSFKMGAFKLAVDNQLAICPIGLTGTRQFFPNDQWILRPAKFIVQIGNPISPKEKSWAEAVRLRNLVFQEISKFLD